ncbi:MAG: AAA family ATPase [Labilithrix sp.]|nr:AAA family ATPase [Labilithrix sp.]
MTTELSAVDNADAGPSSGPRIEKVVVQNYRCLRSGAITLNSGLNIIVGDNEAGKSTLLEAIHLALTCQLNGRSLRSQIHPHLFNEDAVAEFCAKVNAGQTAPAPEILIEVYFASNDELARFRGTNNSERRDSPGLRLAIKLDEEFGDEYAAHLDRREIAAVPVEFYTVEWMTFANEPVHPRRLPTKSRLIDTTTVIAERGTSRHLLDVVDDDLDGSHRSELALAYRLLKSEFSKHDAVAALNKVLADRTGAISDRSITISLDTTATGSWQNAVVPMLDDVPFSLIGKGEQAALKLRLAVDAASSAGVILVEEPENHQSHPRLSRLLDGFRASNACKQFVVTTHSSFVVNKLGISEVLLFHRGRALRLSDLDKDTGRYFMKLPGHDTLRLILARRAILVEGPSDELVVQRAYRDTHGKMPLDAGVEVISVGALAFKRFIAIGKVVKKAVAVVTDNDGDPAAARKRYATDALNIKLCVSDEATLPSLEQQLVASNSLETINAALGKDFATTEDARVWMTANKTEVALRIFESATAISYPQYIRDAVDE